MKPINQKPRGFTLLETMIAMVLVAFAMTALMIAFTASGQFGVLGRRQATALTLGRSLATTLSHAAYTDARLTNNNTGNDLTFADPAGLFAATALPTGVNAPDAILGTALVGNESYDEYVNVSPVMDPNNLTAEQGRQFAVIVRYKVGTTRARAVVIGFRYNPAAIGVGQLAL